MSFQAQLPGGSLQFVVLCDFDGRFSRIWLFDKTLYREEAEILFADDNVAESLSIFEVSKQAPRIFQDGLSERLEVGAGDHSYTIIALVEWEEPVSGLPLDVGRYRLVLKAVSSAE